jgi:aryl-alcohol dehydrogenase-like predicted oxidoreductase
MSQRSTVETIGIGGALEVSRIAKGNWQLAEKHGAPYQREEAIEDMRRFVEAGVTLFDCADHYVGVEPLIGEFRQRYPEHAKVLRVSTKIVPDLESLGTLSRRQIERIVDTSLKRLGVEQLDLAQFHWWDYAQPGYVQAMGWLRDLQIVGKIRLLGTTNFDTLRLKEIVDAGVIVATNQLQYSVLDRRPEHGMVKFCAAHGIQLLCYGVLAGGFIAERWLNSGDPKPPFANRSLVKYRLIIEDFGGWSRFQGLLSVLDQIGKRHTVSLSSVATRYILDKPSVASAIIGARSAQRLDETLQAFSFKLGSDDRALIDELCLDAAGPVGDCYELERQEGGTHSSIMWKNQNQHGVPADTSTAYQWTAARPAGSLEP